MQATPGAERTLTELDFTRLHHLPGDTFPPGFADILSTADVLDSRAVSPDTITMYSQVELEDVATHRPYKLTLCYPNDSEPTAGFISVLSPVGRGLLGLRVGDIAHWQTPSAKAGAAKVVAILFQPEACGDYTL